MPDSAVSSPPSLAANASRRWVGATTTSLVAPPQQTPLHRRLCSAEARRVQDYQRVAAGHAVQHEAGWSDGDVAEATAKLRDKGWLDKQGRATDICHEGRKQIEELTDQMNAHHWMEIGAETSRELSSLLTVINKQLPKDDQIDWREIYENNEPQS